MTAEIVKYKTVSITVYPWRHPSGKDYWRFQRNDGKHVTRSTLDKAKAEAKTHAQDIHRGTLDLNTLTPQQIRAMKRMIEADPTCRLVDEFLVWHGKKAPKKLVKDAYEDFVALKDTNAGRSTQNAKTLRKHVKPFVDLHGKSQLAAITVGDVENYLISNPKNGNRTRRNIRASVVTFFRWCRLREYLPDERTAAEKAEIPVVADTIPETYSPAELAVLLANVRTEYRAWLAIAAWAGVRTDEICPIAGSRKIPLDWSDVDFERKIITVRPETAKMNRRGFRQFRNCGEIGVTTMFCRVRNLHLLNLLLMKIRNDPPPPKRIREPRLTDAMKALKPGQSVVVCPKTAHCLAAYLRYHGLESRRATVSKNQVQVWALSATDG